MKFSQKWLQKLEDMKVTINANDEDPDVDALLREADRLVRCANSARNCRRVGGIRRRIPRSNSKRMRVSDSANITRRTFTAMLIRRKILTKKTTYI